MLPQKNISYSLMKNVHPIWYFHLIPYDRRNRVWIEYKYLSNQQKELINIDNKYSSRILTDWDSSYQALMRGIIKESGKNIQVDDIKLLPTDIYRFIRKYHRRVWLFITFLQRILFLNNPIRECLGLWKTRKVNNVDLFKKYYVYDTYNDFNSKLIITKPYVNIIIPTLNRYEELNNLLQDLEKQTYTNFEVIIIDQSNPFQKEFYNDINFNYHVIRQEKQALWKARNCGIKFAKSEYLLFLDDDSKIESNWISEHLKCIDFFNADISSGISKSVIGAKIPENYSFFRWSDQLDTGNVLIKKKVFETCGLFDEQFEKMRMGDGEFGTRAYLYGFKNISNPHAYREHLKISKGGLRDMGHWDAYRPKNIFGIRPVPSILYFYRKYWGNETAILSCLTTIPFALLPYKYKSFIWASIISFLLFLLLFPFITSQVFYSWIKSTNMLNTGHKIQRL